jgi:hypothetical protein
MYYAYLMSIYDLDDYSCLSMQSIYEMECVVVPLHPCYINVILSIFTICHTILSHDCTYSFRHPTFCKIVQLSSHMLLSVILAIINPFLIVEKL